MNQGGPIELAVFHTMLAAIALGIAWRRWDSSVLLCAVLLSFTAFCAWLQWWRARQSGLEK